MHIGACRDELICLFRLQSIHEFPQGELGLSHQHIVQRRIGLQGGQR